MKPNSGFGDAEAKRILERAAEILGTLLLVRSIG